MPFKSEAQRRWMHANHPEMAKRWEAETGDTPLPDRVGRNHTASEPDPALKRALEKISNYGR